MKALSSCETCKKMNDEVQRQGMGCGYLPPLENRLPLWTPQAFHGELAVCPGYTTKLPIVVETTRARIHWEKGALELFAGGKPEMLALTAIEILDGAARAFKDAIHTPESEGGLRKD